VSANDLSALLQRGDEDDRDHWFSGVEGIVAENKDPEHRCRVQCKIPLVDEENVYPIWARRINLFTGGPGYGDFHPPEKGTEVVLWGRLNDMHNLFYAPLYNEDYPVPTDFRNLSTRGIRNDGNYSIITDGHLYIRAGTITIESDSSVRIIGPGGIFNMDRRES
jgi:hypothetical protein